MTKSNDKKVEKISIAETIKIAGKALKISLQTRSKLSLIVNLLGFGMSFLPALISTTLRRLTDEILILYGTGYGNAAKVLSVFALLALLFIIQALYKFLNDYSASKNVMKINRYIKETIISCICKVKYKYIENYDDFIERIMFADTYTGKQVAGSMQQVVIWLQNLITFMSIVFILIKVNVWIVVILLVSLIPALILATNQKDEECKLKTKYLQEGSFIIHYFHIITGWNERSKSLLEVRYLNMYEYIKNKWKEVSKIFFEKRYELTKKHVIYNSVADILRNTVYIGVLIIAAQKIYQNPEIGLGTFMLVYTMSGQLQEFTAKMFTGAAKFLVI